jgi:hypothetical protein
MPRKLIVGIVLFAVFAGNTPSALAHNISSDVTGKFPYYTGTAARFDTVHTITGCVNNGDGQTCAQGIDFKAESSCQFYVLGGWHDCQGSTFSNVKHYPTYTKVTAVFWVQCSGSTSFPVRTRGRGWINHLGTWYASPWSVGPSRTIACSG